MRPVNQWLKRHRVGLKVVFFIACSLPFISVVYDFFKQNLGANPVEVMTHESGQWGLRFLLLGLAITPLKQFLSLNALQAYRRQIGLWALFYIGTHFCVYFIFDQSLQIEWVIEDIIERPYILLGMLGLILLIPLGITSWSWWQKKLGKRWLQLHRLVYVAAIAGVAHFWWLVKADLLEPIIYALILAVLLLARVVNRYRKRRS